MKWGVKWARNTWVVYEVATGVEVCSHWWEVIARREAARLNERGV
ncbi:hypothetical protein [Pseudomonas phage GP100]|nr:hypothetical protein [Pseudomonas phage GP100]